MKGFPQLLIALIVESIFTCEMLCLSFPALKRFCHVVKINVHILLALEEMDFISLKLSFRSSTPNYVCVVTYILFS